MGPTSMPPSAVPLPPGGPIEIVFSFDTTGSMSECLDQVRGQLAHVIERLFADIPGLRISVFAHGDYCDLDMYGYVTKYVDFTTDVAELCRFVNEVSATGGGDFEECYELVLRQVREQLSWQPGTQRALVMIGDATPHEPDAPVNTEHIDWKNETSRLVNENGVHIYAVQCLQNKEADAFFEHLSMAGSDGKHLRLDELTNIVDIMMAICYREKGVEFFEAYEKEVRTRDGSAIRADVDRMFATLKDPQPSCSSAPDVGMTLEDISNDDDDDDDDVASTASGPTSGLFRTPPTTIRRRRISSASSRSSATSVPTTMHPMTLRRRDSKGWVLQSDPKSLVRRRDPRAKPKSTPTQRCYEKALREQQKGDDFLLFDLDWTNWRCAVALNPPTSSRAASSWVSRHRGAPDPTTASTSTSTPGPIGSRKRHLFPDMSVPAVYEIAVEAPNSVKKTPVLSSVTKGLDDSRSWEGALLFSPHVKEQVNKVVQRGCKLYVRRAPFSKDNMGPLVAKSGLKAKDVGTDEEAINQLRGLLIRSCDYCWRRRYDKSTESRSRVQRPLTWKKVTISE